MKKIRRFLDHSLPLNRFAVQPRNTRYASQYTASAKRAGIKKAKSKILKKFSDSLTPYFTMTYLFPIRYSLYAIRYFFDQTRSFAPL